ncbi:3-dehydroquinate synthase [Ekhidna sp.]|jgi:3-dehydroquinate synthase|uniref:3-dehydroquinate synthase n=1 Tax=Ekhidna sp. TaxID=2608089 RepID=UPI0032EC0494
MSNNLPSYLDISKDINSDLSNAIETLNPDKIAILVDENTKKYCLPHLHVSIDTLIEIQSGEQHKTLETCSHIWHQLTAIECSRKSLLINLGGGVIGDMGGFAASTYKRGMPFINIPTTLLSQVDASVGGKLGIDFEGLKNHIGVFQDPARVIINTEFLKTLPKRELKSGFAEIIKHALIRSTEQWEYLNRYSFEEINWDEIIPKSISIKNEVVQEDPLEGGIRKVLNYGHTVGHALESYFLNSKTPLLHGEAIAWGMILENEIAVIAGLLSKGESEVINGFIRSVYDINLELPAYELLRSHLLQDKKNDAQGIRFSLLEKIGACAHDVLVEETVLKDILK